MLTSKSGEWRPEIGSAGLSMWGAWCKQEVGGLYIRKLPLTANAENRIKVNTEA